MDGSLVTEEPETPAQQLAFIEPTEQFQVVVPPGLATVLMDLPLHRSAAGAIRALGWPTPRERVQIDADLSTRSKGSGSPSSRQGSRRPRPSSPLIQTATAGVTRTSEPGITSRP